MQPLRAFEDGDISFAHLEYFLAPMGHVVGFEVHRWDDGRIVEHWDNLQPLSEVPNSSGRTMTDGPTESDEPERTAENKTKVERFLSRVLIDGRTDDVAEYFYSNRLLQHSHLRRRRRSTRPNAGPGPSRRQPVVSTGTPGPW